VQEVLSFLRDARKKHAAYKKLYPWDFEMIMQVTVMKYNYRELEGIADFAHAHKFAALNIIPIQNVQGEENIFLHQDQEAIGYIKKVMPLIQEKAKKYRIRFQNQLPEVAQSQTPPSECCGQKVRDHAAALNGTLSCYWPWYGLFILFEGRTKPYGFCREDVEWDLNTHSLGEIWNNSLMQEYRKKIIAKENDDLCEKRCTCGIIERSQLGLELK
ncbi:MAG: SPASM domain-containing protein, partial [Candidatus Omnitrophica bacterium]|nr:SPASM domain-containing protein [Candidatus Omnitrophota bacterium]